jgi:rRNA maturation RNase YbeY
MNIEINNRQRRFRVPAQPLTQLARWTMDRVQARNRAIAWQTLSVALVDDAGIAAVHGDYLGSAKPTDVISFAYPPAPGEDEGHTGEVVVNVQRAVEAGARYQGSGYELALYLAHGCHHLSGADDDTPERRRRMRQTEQRWLRQPAARQWIEQLVIEPV